MTSDQTDTLADRLHRYANDAADAAPAGAMHFADRTDWRRGISVAVTVAAAVVLTVAALALTPEVGLAPGQSPGVSEPPLLSDQASPASEPPLPSPSDEPPATEPTAGADATPVPSIPGEVPPSDASIPPRPAPFGDASLYEIYAAASRHGLTCESMPYDMSHGTDDDLELYVLGCEASSDGVALTVVVSYWRVDYVEGVDAGAVSSQGAAIDSRRPLPLFEDLLVATLDDAAEAAAKSYMLAHYDDSSCGPNAECRLRLQDGEMMWLVGENGARQLDLGIPRD